MACCFDCVLFSVFGTIVFSRYYCSESLLPLDYISVSVLVVFICAQNVFRKLLKMEQYVIWTVAILSAQLSNC